MARFKPHPSLAELGPAAAFAWDEFFGAQISNPHTRAAYLRAVRRFLDWAAQRRVAVPAITPGMVGEYLASHPGSPPTRKLALAALRAFFDVLVLRHVAVLNPAASVRGERYQVVEGATPEITPQQARHLLASIGTASVIDQRDRAVIATLIFTAARAGAVARLRMRHLEHDGTQHVLRFGEKGGKQRKIPVRHDLEGFLRQYLAGAGLEGASRDTPLFQSVARRKGNEPFVTGRPFTGVDICRMVKRRLAAAGLPADLSPHSFRVCTITDLLTHGAALEDVQFLAGHADPRTTRLYDRRQKQITRNLVERILV
jgi:integrase/recombinase XerD